MEPEKNGGAQKIEALGSDVERTVRPLILHLKCEYWEDIRDGRKPEEYRAITPYWEKRLLGKIFSEVWLILGYPSHDDSRTLRRKWKGMREAIIETRVYGGAKPVFAIDVSEAEIPIKYIYYRILLFRVIGINALQNYY